MLPLKDKITLQKQHIENQIKKGRFDEFEYELQQLRKLGLSDSEVKQFGKSLKTKYRISDEH